MVLFSRLCNGLGPFRVVDGIWGILGLQADAAALAVNNAALAGLLVNEVARVELHAGAVGVDGHCPPGARVGQLGAGIAEDLPVVVVAPLEVQRVVIPVNVPPDGLGAAEIHGSAFHAPLLPGGNAFGVIGIEPASGHGQQLPHGSLLLLMARQIEIAVIGQVENGVPVTDRVIGDVQPAVTVQGIGHPDVGIAGETLIPMGAAQFKCDGIGGVGHYLPQPCVVTVRAGVEVVAVLVGGQVPGSA